MDKTGVMQHLIESCAKYIKCYTSERQKVKALTRNKTPTNCEDSRPWVMGYACNPDSLMWYGVCNSVRDPLVALQIIIGSEQVQKL